MSKYLIITATARIPIAEEFVLKPRHIDGVDGDGVKMSFVTYSNEYPGTITSAQIWVKDTETDKKKNTKR